jgi:pilus assembly protein CpaF
MPTEIEKLVAAFQDPGISELMINDDGSVYVERAGAVLEQISAKASAQDIATLLKALVGDQPGFGPQRPYADLSAADGSRVHVIAPPLARGGVCVTIRKRPTKRPTLDELVQAGTMTQGCAGFLDFAIQQQKNMIIVGGTSSGKTTLLSALAAGINPKSRILVLEDTPELALPQSHVMYLKTRLRDVQGAPDVTLADLLVNTLRMRPDRIIIGEVRGPEASDMLQAMNVGQEGVLSTLHANSCREALQRLETLVLMAGLDMPLKAVRNNIALAVDLIVFMSRLSDGTRRVIQVAEITGIEVENITMSDLFKTESRKSPGGVSFALKPTGAMPRFYDQLRQQGFEPPLDFFKS